MSDDTQNKYWRPFLRFFSWILMHCRIKTLSLRCLRSYRTPPTGRGWADIYIIRRNWTLLFWLVRTSHLLRIVKNKATETPCGMYCIRSPLASDRPCRSSPQRVLCILTSAWGFQRCSFRQSGQCEGLNKWNGRQTGSTFLVFVYQKSNDIKILPQGPRETFVDQWNVTTAGKQSLKTPPFARNVGAP